MDIYKETDYRIIIKNIIEQEKKYDNSINYQQMANEINMPKSYLSKVINNRADFNSDQLYLACLYLKLSQVESNYMQLLLEYTRTIISKRKKELKTEIDKIQKKQNEVIKKIKAEYKINKRTMQDYYLNPIHQIIHIALSISRYRNNIDLIASELHIPIRQVIESINKLISFGIIEQKNDEYHILIKNIHLPRENYLYKNWRNQIRQLGIIRLNQLSNKDGFAFSVTISADEKAFKELHEKLLAFIKEAESSVMQATSKNIYQLNLDLFKWND